MSEKVLGFREKRAKGCIWTECGTGKRTIEIKRILGIYEEMDIVKKKAWQKIHKEVELVPVVSLSWLEKYQKDNFLIGQRDKDLLSAAKKEAKQ